ncbi:MAG: DegT/DnrJ/EryC1/StrS aminotransferase family protein, partial [Bdellovibrionota bacterium]|nr:DegT/DnrJ/EryC1/StrS aminotransferase family protein [Bdellovibrionota bacterium]
AAITDKTKAIMPVSLYGLTADMEAFMEIAKDENIAIIEDGAQSFGASYKAEGKTKTSCNVATISTTSFYPAKPLGAYGDAGAVFTNDDALALKMRQLLNHGQERGYHHIHIGFNGRIDTIQAAILIEKLNIFKNEIELRNQVASKYQEAFNGKIKMQKIPEEHISSWAQFTIEVDDRDKFRESLQKESIPTAVHYPAALTEQPIYSEKFNADTPYSKKAASRVVSLPMNPYLSAKDQATVIEAVLKYI